MKGNDIGKARGFCFLSLGFANDSVSSCPVCVSQCQLSGILPQGKDPSIYRQDNK